MKKRIISAIVLLVILLPVIYFGGFYYYIALGIISLFAYKEIICLPVFAKLPTLIKICGSIFYLPIVIGGLMNSDFTSMNYLYLVVLFIYLLVPSLFYKESDYKLKDALYMGSLMIFVGVGFASLIYARESLSIFIYLVSIPVISDTFAMLTGVLIGKHKLCPDISPKKTIEGSIGGLLIGAVVPLIIYNYLVGIITINVVVVTLVLALFSQIGDLIFSKIKRENDIKDYSNLIPGHGGVLDRVDSIMFVTVIYLVISSIL